MTVKVSKEESGLKNYWECFSYQTLIQELLQNLFLCSIKQVYVFKTKSFYFLTN